MAKFKVGQVVRFRRDGKIGRQNRENLLDKTYNALWLVVYSDFNWRASKHATFIWRGYPTGNGANEMPIDPECLEAVPEPSHPVPASTDWWEHNDFETRRKKALSIQRKTRKSLKDFDRWSVAYEQELIEQNKRHEKLMEEMRTMIKQDTRQAEPAQSTKYTGGNNGS